MNKKVQKKTKDLSNRQLVNQSNELINARYELSPLQKKLILLAIAQIDPINDLEAFCYKTTVAELENKLQEKINYARFRDDCIDLFKKPLYFRNTNVKSRRKWIVCNWFSSIEYDEGEVIFQISDKLLPYLVQFKGNFTQYEISQALNFKGKYTIRFYEWLRQIKNQEYKKRVFGLEEIYELLELPTTLKVFKDFRIKVLEPSIKEINEKSDIKAQYKAIKQGRKFVEIELSFESKERLQEKTKPARESKNLAKYKGKWCLYLGYLCKIDFVKINEETKKLEAIYTDDTNEQCRLDFDSIEALNLACLNGKAEYNYRKANPEKFKKADCSEQVVNLFSKMF